MAFVPVPNTVEVEVVYDLDGQICENTLYFFKDAEIGISDITSLLSVVRNAIEDELLPLLHTSISLIRLVGTLLDAAEAISVVASVIPAVPGGLGSSAALPNGTAYAIQFKTPNRGRSFRGRNYVMAIPVGVRSDANTIASSYRDSLLAAYTSIGAAGADDGWIHVVVSRYHNGAPRVTGLSTAVNAYAASDLTLDSQRRRLPGRGA